MKQNVLQQRWRLHHRCQAKFLIGEISNFTSYAHAQSNIQHIKYAEKTVDYGLGFGVQVNVSG